MYFYVWIELPEKMFMGISFSGNDCVKAKGFIIQSDKP